MTKAEWIAHLRDMMEYSREIAEGNAEYDDDDSPWVQDVKVLTEVIEFLKNCEVNV